MPKELRPEDSASVVQKGNGERSNRRRTLSTFSPGELAEPGIPRPIINSSSRAEQSVRQVTTPMTVLMDVTHDVNRNMQMRGGREPLFGSGPCQLHRRRQSLASRGLVAN